MAIKDSELRQKILQKYYEKRKEKDWIPVTEEFFGNEVARSELLRISEQLQQQGLIEFKLLRGDDRLTAGRGRITKMGTDTVENDMVQNLVSKPSPVEVRPEFVDSDRIDELRAIANENFDLAKLIRFCEEINICYQEECYLAVAMLTRALVDHVPPIFDYSNFTEVANNHGGKGGKTLKASFQHLDIGSRKIADFHLHSQIQKRETLPNKTQVDCRASLDLLLAEIVRLLK